MNPKLLALVTCWHVCALLADRDQAGSAPNNATPGHLILQLTPGSNKKVIHSLVDVFDYHHMSVIGFLHLTPQNLSLRLFCQESTTTPHNLSADKGLCLHKEAFILFTADKGTTQKDVAQSDGLPLYIFTTICAGALLMSMFAAALFLLRRFVQRQVLKKTCQASVEDYEQPRYENLSDQFTSVTASASREVGHTATISVDTGKEQAQNSPIDMNVYNHASSISHLVKTRNWSATNSSMKESSCHDDISDGISFDDSGKDSGSLYITPSHRTSSSEETRVDIKPTRFKPHRPPNIPRQQPAVSNFTRQGDTHGGSSKLHTASPSQMANTKHRIHVTWKDSHQNIKSITEELNKQQRKRPKYDDDYYRCPSGHPMLLSRNFASQQTLPLKAKLCYNSRHVDFEASQRKSQDENKLFYSESDLDEACSVSTTSINRFSTVAYANTDVTRASVCSSSLDGGHGLNSMFKRNSLMCFLDTSSYMSSVSKRSDAV